MAANVLGDALVDADTIVGDSKEMVELLVSLGADINTAKTLMCLHVHGPSKSSELEIIRVISSASKGRGRPSHIYELALPLNQALIPFRNQAKERLAILQNQLSRLSELADSASD